MYVGKFSVAEEKKFNNQKSLDYVIIRVQLQISVPKYNTGGILYQKFFWEWHLSRANVLPYGDSSILAAISYIKADLYHG